MKNCGTCAFYSAIDPTAGNCRVSGGTRDKIVAAAPEGTCALQQPVANDNPPRLRAA